jgi:hypothetical protein
MRAAERLYAGLVADGRGDYQERHQLATVQGGLMLIARHRGDLAGAAALGESALALRQKNLAEQPGLVPLRSACASEAINLSWVLSETPGSAARALALAQAGQAELERLAQENPATPAWRDSALRANLHVARAHLALGQAALALPLIEALLDPTLEPARRGGAERIAWSGLEHALALHGLGDQDRAHEALHTAQQALGALAGGPAPNLAWTQKRAAEVARLLADPDAAAAAPGRTS